MPVIIHCCSDIHTIQEYQSAATHLLVCCTAEYYAQSGEDTQDRPRTQQPPKFRRTQSRGSEEDLLCQRLAGVRPYADEVMNKQRTALLDMSVQQLQQLLGQS